MSKYLFSHLYIYTYTDMSKYPFSCIYMDIYIYIYLYQNHPVSFHFLSVQKQKLRPKKSIHADLPHSSVTMAWILFIDGSVCHKKTHRKNEESEAI